MATTVARRRRRVVEVKAEAEEVKGADGSTPCLDPAPTLGCCAGARRNTWLFRAGGTSGNGRHVPAHRHCRLVDAIALPRHMGDSLS